MLGRVRDVEGSARSSECVRASLEILEAFEIRQDVIETPSPTAHLRPGVIVERIAPNIDASIDRGGASQDTPARHGKPAAARMSLGRRAQAPIHVRVRDGLSAAERELDPELVVLRPRLKKKDRKA